MGLIYYPGETAPVVEGQGWDPAWTEQEANVARAQQARDNATQGDGSGLVVAPPAAPLPAGIPLDTVPPPVANPNYGALPALSAKIAEAQSFLNRQLTSPELATLRNSIFGGTVKTAGTGGTQPWADVNTLGRDFAYGKISEAEMRNIAAANGIDPTSVLNLVSVLRGEGRGSGSGLRPVQNNAGDTVGFMPLPPTPTTPPTTPTDPYGNLSPFPADQDILTLGEGDVGQLPEEYRSFVESIMRLVGFTPTSFYGAYGARQYQRPPGTPRLRVTDETIDKATGGNTNARVWLGNFFYRKGLKDTAIPVVTYPTSTPTGTNYAIA